LYRINHCSDLSAPEANWDREDWQAAEILAIINYPWPDSGHRPRTKARLLYTDTAVALLFRVEDRYVRAVETADQGAICHDSCVEFFVAPKPQSNNYFNIEVTCGGTMLFNYMLPREEQPPGWEPIIVSAEHLATIPRAHSLPQIVDPEITDPLTWTLEYHIPFAVFQDYMDLPTPLAETVWRANFYKCADSTSHPHWGTWLPVDKPRPNFHVPADFGPIVFS
jgi:hypothetical protein